jgi:hypothetical protein
MTDGINTNVLEVRYEARAPHSEERISKITDDRRCGESEITVPCPCSDVIKRYS